MEFKSQRLQARWRVHRVPVSVGRASVGQAARGGRRRDPDRRHV